MSSDIVLTSALRNNLQSLQNTQRLIDTTQLRLATGLRVNSALDNPQSFFTAQSLNDRAGDLTRLLDNVNLSIRTIEGANSGVEALNSLIDQSTAIVNSARDELASSDNSARLLSTIDLTDLPATGLGGLGSATALPAATNITGAETLRITTTDDSGANIEEIVALGTGTINSVAANITNAFADNENGEIVASISEQGFLSIESTDGRTFRVEFDDGTDQTVAANATATEERLSLLGLDAAFSLEQRSIGGVGGETLVQATTVVGGNTVSSVSLFEAPGDLAEASDAITGTFENANGQTILSGAANLGITVDLASQATPVTIAATTTFQGFVDSINSNTQVNDSIRAEFDSQTGQIRVTALSDDVRNVTFQTTTVDDGVFNLGFGDPTGNLDALDNAATREVGTIDVEASVQQTVVTFNSSTAALDSLASDFNDIRAQIDQLVEDASFRGINLLAGDDLTTFFNEDNSNSLTTEGANFTSLGLGLNEASFRNSSQIESAANEARVARNTVRAFGNSIANDLAVITSRRDFTENTVRTLESGANDLTVADANEEGANLLALQTRQALGTTSLSLASQSQQDVLRLF